MNSRLVLLIANIIFVVVAAELGTTSDVYLQSIYEDFQDIKSQLGSCDLNPEKFKYPYDEREIFDIRVDSLPRKCKKHALPKNCAEATSCTQRSGIYALQIPQLGNSTFLAECDVKTHDGGWTIIQRRLDGSIDFYRGWQEFKHGFGDVQGEYFIGLDKLHALTNFMGLQELLILMDGEKYASYNNFVIGNEAEKYVLKTLGKYVGTAGDSLSPHLGEKFTTKDQDNDKYPDGNCAVTFTGAWWYKNCHKSNLNGKYGDEEFGKGINWDTLSGRNKSLVYVQMMTRRRRF